ncbi:MAG: MATE family efflux transporter [Clostridia bacterium]|nr:MATE family efflux transporter [Clostridia bacterium]
MPKRASYEMDMLNGPLLGKIIRFSLSLMLTNILQLLYNAADLIIIGQFSGSETSVAAVGATGSLTNLIVNLFIGLSVGVSVLVARGYGTGNRKATQDIVHTSMTVALISGVIVLAVGMLLSGTFLQMMGTSPAIIDQSKLYLMIYFAGAPFNMIYNFGASVLRATGDTKRPLYFLTLAGLINVVLNFIFVYYFHMDVAGVALATIISQGVSAVLIVMCLMKQDGMCRLEPKKLRIDKDVLMQIIRIGLPASIQSTLFSISNILIQSSINSFDTVFAASGIAPYTSGSAASANIESFVYMSMNAFYQASLNFTGQNIAAEKYRRMRRILTLSLMCVTVVGAVMGGICLLFGKQLLSVYIPNDLEAIGYGYRRLFIICATYWLCGIMDVVVGQLRGLGRSLVPMLVSVIGICGFRILWINTIFAAYHTWEMLFISYPVSWILTSGAHLLCYFIIQRKLPKEDQNLVSQT